MSLNCEQTQILSDWFEAKRALDDAKSAELELRRKVASFFSMAEDEEGTETIDLGDGFKVKKTQKLNYSVDSLGRVEEVLSKIDFIAYPGAMGVFRFKPELSVSIYRTLADEVKFLVDSVLTTKPASPTIEIIAPKEKKK